MDSVCYFCWAGKKVGTTSCNVWPLLLLLLSWIHKHPWHSRWQTWKVIACDFSQQKMADHWRTRDLTFLLSSAFYLGCYLFAAFISLTPGFANDQLCTLLALEDFFSVSEIVWTLQWYSLLRRLLIWCEFCVWTGVDFFQQRILFWSNLMEWYAFQIDSFPLEIFIHSSQGEDAAFTIDGFLIWEFWYILYNKSCIYYWCKQANMMNWSSTVWCNNKWRHAKSSFLLLV